MTEKDLLLQTLECLQAFYADPHPLSEEYVDPCITYIRSKIENKKFNRDDKEEWEKYKTELYSRLENKSPMTIFELTLGMPGGVGPIILDEICYGKMYETFDYLIGVKQ
jgi:hypothetical protein